MRKIRVAIERGQTQIVLEVPEFVPGLPLYDRQQATKYLARQLELLGYTSNMVSEWSIHTSWKAQPKESTAVTSYQHLAQEIRRKKGV